MTYSEWVSAGICQHSFAYPLKYLYGKFACELMVELMILGVMLGGALGALARYLTTLFIQQALQQSALATFPVATFFVNLIGSFLLSFLLYSQYFDINPALRTAIGTGFIGSLTTFSTFELEAQQLFVKGQWFIALSYLLGSVTLGFFAILLGKFLATQLST